MTRSELRTRILDALNEDASSPVFWSTSQIDAVIDEASEVLAEEAQSIRRSAFLSRESGKLFYSTRGIADDVMAIYRVWASDLNRRLTAVSHSQLDAQHEIWQTVTGDPEYWFPVSWDLFGIYPHPSQGGGLLRIDYFAWPRTLMDDDDEPEFREADHDGLVLYGVYDGLLKQWNLQRALELFARFADRWLDAKERAGVREQQSRLFQSAAIGGPSFRSNVER